MESQETTRRWIESALRGDRQAFSRLFETHRAPLEAAVRRRLGRRLRARIEVEDVVQETFLKAMVALPSYRDEGEGSFLGWLRGIADNLLLYWARREQRLGPLDPGLEPEHGGPSPSRQLRREERFERLELALSGLSADHREVILLARVEELPLLEIARRLGRSEAATKQLLWRAVRKLGESFGETESLRLPPRSLRDEEDRP